MDSRARPGHEQPDSSVHPLSKPERMTRFWWLCSRFPRPYATRPSNMTVPERFWRSSALFLAGLGGSVVLFLTLHIPPSVRATIGGDEITVRLRMLTFNASLLLVTVLLGSVFAHRAGLTSLAAHRVADARRRLPTLLLYVVAGAVVGLVMRGVDASLTNAVPELRSFSQAHESALSTLHFGWGVRALYGGVTEELMWRWGVMSVAAWLLLRWLSRRWALGVAILLSALLFGLDHLPLLFQLVPDVPVTMSLRVVLLNVAVGIAFGIAYAYDSLEAAIVMHAAMHMFYFGVGIG